MAHFVWFAPTGSMLTIDEARAWAAVNPANPSDPEASMAITRSTGTDSKHGSAGVEGGRGVVVGREVGEGP